MEQQQASQAQPTDQAAALEQPSQQQTEQQQQQPQADPSEAQEARPVAACGVADGGDRCGIP